MNETLEIPTNVLPDSSAAPLYYREVVNPGQFVTIELPSTSSCHNEAVNSEQTGTHDLPGSSVSLTNAVYYSDALAGLICDRLANSTDTLADICSEPGMPSVNSVYRWKRHNPHFKEQYEKARQQQVQLPGHNKERHRFTMEIGEALCHAVAGSGVSIKTFCSQPGMPHPVTISRWLLKYPALREKYEAALACVTQKTEYSDALADKICAHIATTTRGLHETCKALEINVHITTLFRWLRKYDYFREQYQLAKEVQADLMIEQILHIADDTDYSIPIAHLRLRIRVRQWVAGRLNPAKWGTARQEKALAHDKRDIYIEPAKQKPEWLTMKIGNRERGMNLANTIGD